MEDEGDAQVAAATAKEPPAAGTNSSSSGCTDETHRKVAQQQSRHAMTDASMITAGDGHHDATTRKRKANQNNGQELLEGTRKKPALLNEKTKREVVNIAIDQHQQYETYSQRSSESREVNVSWDLKKLGSGHLIEPCRARGMPMDHNEQSAYFILTSDIAHGDGLVCSHELCRKEGVKFRYCTHCQGPVAKRNFSTRHDHSTEQGKDEGSDDNTRVAFKDQGGIPTQVTTNQQQSGGPSDEMTSTSSGAGGGGAANTKKPAGPKVSNSSSSQLGSANASSETASGSYETNSVRAYGSSSTSSTHSYQQRDRDDEQAAKQAMEANKLPSRVAAAVASNPRSAHLQNLEDIGTIRRFEWARLLGKRPQTDNRDELSAWLLDILAVSDLNDPLKVVDSSSPTMDDYNESSSGTNNGSIDSSAPTDQSGTADSSRTDGSSANDSSSDTRERNNGSTDLSPTDGSSNDSANDSSSDTQEQARSPDE